MKQFILTGLFLISLVGCGGSGSSGSGEVGDRADLSGAAGNNTSSGNGAATSSASSLVLQGLEAVKDQSAETTVDCTGGGTLTTTTSSTIGETSGDTIPITLTVSSTATSCGEDQLTGTMTMTGKMDVTVSDSTTKISGDFELDFSGSTAACSSMTGDLSAALDYSGNSGTITINGTMTGTCSGGAASCTFDDVKLTTSDTEAQMKAKMCAACDVPAESCS